MQDTNRCVNSLWKYQSWNQIEENVNLTPLKNKEGFMSLNNNHSLPQFLIFNTASDMQNKLQNITHRDGYMLKKC